MIQKFVHQYFQPSFLPEKRPKLLSVSYIPQQFNKLHPRMLHQHTDAFELLFITGGEGYYYLDTTYYQIQKGDLVFCNSGVLHDELPKKNKDLSFYALRLTGSAFRNLPDNHLIAAGMCPVVSLKERFDVLEGLFKVLYEHADGAHHMEEFCENLMLSILTLVISDVYDNGTEKITLDGQTRLKGMELIYQIKQYIDGNYHNDLSLEELGNIFHLSPYYLSHIFKDAFQLPPMQYLYRRRIGEAQSLLTTTEDSITEIASQVGFGNSNYFTIQFKKYVGLTPSTYRRIYAQPSSDK